MGNHFYNDFGEACYNTGLKEARKLKLLPSVTSVESVLAKQNILIETCIKYNEIDMSLDHYSVNDYKAFIKTEAFKDSRQKMKLGTVIHHMAERYILGKPLFFQGGRADVWEIFAPVKEWIDINLVAPDTGLYSDEGAEKILVNTEIGYAGKADLKGKLSTGLKVILDFKTTTVKKSDIKKDGTIKKAKLYDSYIRQLAALDMCTDSEEDNILMSVIISTDPDNYGVWQHIWNDADKWKAWTEFTAALQIFRSVKKL